MNPPIIVAEDDFTLEFRTVGHLDPVDCDTLRKDIIDPNGYVLQEKIILPPRLADQAAKYSAQSIDPLKCNSPLILIGHPDLPAQYTSLIVRPKQGRSRAEKHDAAIKVTAAEMNLLFSAPIFSGAEKTVHSFSLAFDKVSSVLHHCGMEEASIARTWLYLDDVLNDYDLLNQSRELFFARWYSPGKHFIPASTGIEGHMAARRPLTIQFGAFSGKRVGIRQQASPLQNEATRYGKLFSRCVVVELPRHQFVFISGTASIDKAGISVYKGDFDKQLVFTLEVLSAILREVNGSFANVVQATVFLKKHEDFNACQRILSQAGFPRAQTLFLPDTPVCRDDLLCEIELTAVTKSYSHENPKEDMDNP
jgi:enamine deaminase RidA (YjgF/YER057c/UK114 family)